MLEQPERLALRSTSLQTPGADDVVVATRWSGISTGTERLLYDGTMPPFPGLAYPLVPGYESVGDVVWAGDNVSIPVGTRVFVPGAACYTDVAALFGASAERLVVPAARVLALPSDAGSDYVLLALAATAERVLAQAPQPDLIVGHGTLGRLLARMAATQGSAPTVWETNPIRRAGNLGYQVLHPDEDPRRDYARIVDVSGGADILDDLIARLVPRGEILLAGFYHERVAFTFPPAFLREVRISVSAEFQPQDLGAAAVRVNSGALSLDGLVTHSRRAGDASTAYREAFEDAQCLKMVLDWETAA